MTVYFKNLPESLLNKWVGEIVDEMMAKPVYSVNYFLKNPNGTIRAFYFMRYENPPILSSLPAVDSTKAFMEDPEVLKKSSIEHPLKHVTQSSLNRAMARLIFEPKAEIPLDKK